MKSRLEIIKWAKIIDKKYSDLKTRYGAFKENGSWRVNLWHPLAKNIDILIFDQENNNEEIGRFKGKFISPNWMWSFKNDLDGCFYQYEITQKNGKVNYALDPFSKSIAVFNWNGTETQIGKAAFVDLSKVKHLRKLNKINNPQPIIYEAHVRNLTSLRKDVTIPGSFNAIKEAKIGEHLQKLGFTAIQFLPVHSCYALNENDKKILGKGKGNGWTTNYNWGYDPHHYFAINGWYSSNPSDPYSRMNEFKQLVKYMHLNNINVILDVVYNHMMTNSILNNVFPNYYFRGGATKENTAVPVKYPPLASDRIMCRRIIIESLIWFVETYDVDGFRFDLVCFLDKQTIKEVIKVLRKIKPNIILHGEAWKQSDLDYNNSFIKGVVDNKLDFAYFNDTTRDAIKGIDDAKNFSSGIVNGNLKEFKNYLTSIIGNIKEFANQPNAIATDSYSRFTKYPNINLQYAACHDGFTLWDKLNLTVKGSKKHKFQIYRQALLLQITTQGRLLFLEGTEMLYTKPNDASGEDGNRYQESENVYDIFNLGTKYNANTYKSTDFSNGLRWNYLQGDIKKYIYIFLREAIKIRTSTPFFNLSTSKAINQALRFNFVDETRGIIDFSIKIKNKTMRVIHNFGKKNYKYKSYGKILLDSIIGKSQLCLAKAYSSQIIMESSNN